ncbi:MAG TPA: DUF1731 domain-containing protein [Pirellulales bacterium]|nr:DUF1731 domain-containing protein [Pirellulales bacterium]
MRELRRAIRAPFGLPAPTWLARLGAAWFLRTDPELALYGRYVVSRRLENAHFAFEFPQVHDALHDLLRPRKKGRSA